MTTFFCGLSEHVILFDKKLKSNGVKSHLPQQLYATAWDIGYRSSFVGTKPTQSSQPSCRNSQLRSAASLPLLRKSLMIHWFQEQVITRYSHAKWDESSALGHDASSDGSMRGHPSIFVIYHQIRYSKWLTPHFFLVSEPITMVYGFYVQFPMIYPHIPRRRSQWLFPTLCQVGTNADWKGR